MLCPKIILIGFMLNLTSIDVSTLKRAKYVCKRDYNSCVKLVEKQGPLAYHVICYNKDAK